MSSDPTLKSEMKRKPSWHLPLGFRFLGSTIVLTARNRRRTFATLVLGCSICLLTPTYLRAELEPTDHGGNHPDQAAVDSLRSELGRLAGNSTYIVVDRPRNRLVIWKSGNILLDAICATGSGKILFGDQRDQTWHFQTPRKVFTVVKKVISPIWKKPAWAFVEKNVAEPVLPWEFNRLDGTTLGSYALELQNSYAIHGTLYPVLLGRSITHGCVRLNDEDLTEAYRLSSRGTRVYVF